MNPNTVTPTLFGRPLPYQKEGIILTWMCFKALLKMFKFDVFLSSSEGTSLFNISKHSFKCARLYVVKMINYSPCSPENKIPFQYFTKFFSSLTQNLTFQKAYTFFTILSELTTTFWSKITQRKFIIVIGLVRTKGRPFSITKMLTRACTFRLRCFTDINNVHFKNFKFTLTCSSRVCYVFPWSLPCDSKHVSQRSLALALRGQTTASIRKTTTTQDTYPPGLLRRSIVSHSEIALLLSVWNGVERGTKRIRKNEGNVNW